MNVGDSHTEPTWDHIGEVSSALYFSPFEMVDVNIAEASEVLRSLNEMAVLNVRSIAALGPAIAAFGGTTSPQLARSIQATGNVWKDIESEYGMHTSMDVARLVGSEKSSRSLAADQRAAGKLIGIKRGNKYVHPGFQFDPRSRKVRPAVPGLLQVAKDVGWDHEDLIFWLVAPSGYFQGERPVDHLDDDDLMDKAHQAATVEW